MPLFVNTVFSLTTCKAFVMTTRVSLSPSPLLRLHWLGGGLLGLFPSRRRGSVHGASCFSRCVSSTSCVKQSEAAVAVRMASTWARFFAIFRTVL